MDARDDFGAGLAREQRAAQSNIWHTADHIALGCRGATALVAADARHTVIADLAREAARYR